MRQAVRTLYGIEDVRSTPERSESPDPHDGG